MRALVPEEEVERLEALYRYDVLDTPAEACFDRLTRVAALLFHAPISLITFVDPERQFFKSAYGLAIRETHRDYAFCAHAIRSADPMIVCNAMTDARFADNPLVLDTPGIRFYAGAPLETSDGFRLGTICVIDSKPREAPEPCEIAALKDLAAQVVDLLELRLKERALCAAQKELEQKSFELEQSHKLRSDTEQRAALALEAGRMGYWDRDAETDLISFSPFLEEMLGLDHSTYDGSVEGWLENVHPEDRKMILAQIAEAQEKEEHYTFKYRATDASGRERWIQTTGTYHKDGEGKFAGAHGVSWDCTASEVAAQQLKMSEELFRGLNASVPVGIFRADVEANITHANSRFAAIFEMSEQESLGHGWRRRLHPEDLDYLDATLNAAEWNNPGVWEHEHRLLLPDGSVRWVHVQISTLRGASGQAVERVGSVDDVTQRRQAMQDLQQAKDAAEVASRAKDLFVSNVSHELRTPLNGVLGMTDVLLDSGLTSEQVEMAELVQESGRILLAIVNDILDLSGIEAGTLALERRAFNLRNTVQQTVALLAREAAEKGLKVNTLYLANAPAWFMGDASRIKQILLNYLSNAIKFTLAGEITITVQSGSPGRTGDVLVAVADTGPGIEPAAQAKLFQSFSQIDGSSTRRNGGVGIGLAICKRLAELMDGSVGVSSVPGKGSTFWVQLPLTTQD